MDSIKNYQNLPTYAPILEYMLLGGINLKLKHLITKFQRPLITTKTIFARNYGTAAVISYNLKGIAPPVSPVVQCWANRNLMSGYAAPTLKRVGGGRAKNMYQEMVYYNRMHVKTRLSQSILSKIIGLGCDACIV
jgi:hypothetical protein